METMQAQRTGADADDVFSLPTLLDSSAAIAAARRLYARNRAGVRFYCENRRVVPVQEIDEAMEDGSEPGGG